MTHDSRGMLEEPTPEGLERYLAGECSLTERERIEAWIRSAPAHHAYVESLRTLGETWAQARPQFDSRAAWQRMIERTTPATVSQSTVTSTPIPSATSIRTTTRHRSPGWSTSIRTSPRHAVANRWLTAAAVAAVMVGAVTLGSRLRPADTTVPARQEYTTAAGQQIALTLTDGTRLRLAPQSRIVIEAEYGRATRTVQLFGQAHFEVTHDDARPFRVRAGNTVAWDLGTKFIVRAYAGERVQVAVEEGSVAIPQAIPAPLLPGDVAVIDSTGRGRVEHNADLGRYTAWLDGTLEFRNTPLSEITADLSRWYGVQVRLGDSTLVRRHLTVSITESSLDAALELVAPAVGARYERHGRVITLYATP